MCPLRTFLPALLAATVLAKSPLTHETMWRMKRLGAPAPSPGGKWVVFSVTEPAYDPAGQVADLWIVPADGSAKPRRLTFTKGAENDVAWSPDNRRIAFSAKREGDSENQIYVLDTSGGEAVRITALSTGAELPAWSPDGSQILFQSLVYPGAPDDEANKKADAERKARKYNARVYDTFPIRYWDHWLDERRPHVFVQAAEPGAKATDLLARSQLAAKPGFDGASTTSGSDLKAAWTPDGSSVVFTATENRIDTAFADLVTSLYQVSMEGGEPKRLTDGRDSYSDAAFRPDGKALYAKMEHNGPKAYSLSRLVMWKWPEMGPPVPVTSGLDRSVDEFVFSPDSRQVYLLAEEAGHVKVFVSPAGGGEARVALDVKVGMYANLRSADKAAQTLLVAAFNSSIHPPELVRLDLAGGRHFNLSDFNAAQAGEIDWQPPEHFWFTAKDGRRINNMLFLRPQFDRSKKYPLVVFIHGGPHTMSRDDFHTRWNYHLLTAPGYAVLATNYKGSTGFGEEFAQAIEGDPLKGPGEEILEAVDEALKRYRFLDAERMVAGGASYGGHLANWLQATTTRFKALYSHAGLIDLESQWGTSDIIYHRERNSGGPVWEQGRVWREQNPIRYAARFKTPILLTVGERDFRVPINQTIENWSVLQRLKIPSKLVVFPDENHWILKGENNRFFFQVLHEWLGKHLGKVQ